MFQINMLTSSDDCLLQNKSGLQTLVTAQYVSDKVHRNTAGMLSKMALGTVNLSGTLFGPICTPAHSEPLQNAQEVHGMPGLLWVHISPTRSKLPYWHKLSCALNF